MTVWTVSNTQAVLLSFPRDFFEVFSFQPHFYMTVWHQADAVEMRCSMSSLQNPAYFNDLSQSGMSCWISFHRMDFSCIYSTDFNGYLFIKVSAGIISSLFHVYYSLKWLEHCDSWACVCLIHSHNELKKSASGQRKRYFFPKVSLLISPVTMGEWSTVHEAKLKTTGMLVFPFNKLNHIIAYFSDKSLDLM